MEGKKKKDTLSPNAQVRQFIFQRSPLFHLYSTVHATERQRGEFKPSRRQSGPHIGMNYFGSHSSSSHFEDDTQPHPLCRE